MKDTLRWAYALNQWNVRLDVFVRHEDQQRALKTVSACGFDTVELAVRHRSLGQHQPARGHPAQPRQPRGLPRLPAPGARSRASPACSGTRRPAGGGGGLGVPVHGEPRRPRRDRRVGEAVRRLPRRRRRRAARRPPGRLGLDEPAARTPTASRSSATCGTGSASWPPPSGVGLALHYDCLGAVHTEDELTGLLDATDPATGRARAGHRRVHHRRHRPGGLLPGARRPGHPRAPQGHPVRRHRRGVPDARRGDDDAQGRRRTADRALVLRARHRGRPGRRAGLRRGAARARTSRAGSWSRATTAATRPSWPCSTAGTCSTSWGWRSDRDERAHQVELHGPLAQQRPGRAGRPVALAQDHVGLPQADQGDRVRRDRHVRLPDLADVRRLRRPGQVPGDGPGPRPRADREHVPRRRLRRPHLRARTCPRRTRTSSRTSGSRWAAGRRSSSTTSS